jgi:hypothetical protein
MLFFWNLMLKSSHDKRVITSKYSRLSHLCSLNFTFKHITLYHTILPQSFNPIPIMPFTVPFPVPVPVLLLHCRGLVDMNAPMSQYWPAFAANGKEGITVVSKAKQIKA